MTTRLGFVTTIISLILILLLGCGEDESSNIVKEKISEKELRELIIDLGDPNWVVRVQAAEKIGQTGTQAKDAVSDLAVLLNDENEMVRTVSAEALRNIGLKNLYASPIVFANWQGIFITDEFAKYHVKIVSFGENPQFSPDNNRILFEESSDEIWLSNLEGTITKSIAKGSKPFWSVSGGKIAFLRRTYSKNGEISSVWIMNADGSNQREIRKLNTYDYGGKLHWISGDSKIVFVDKGEILAINVDGTEEKKLAKGYNPLIIQNDDKIVFLQEEERWEAKLCQMNFDGSDQETLLRSFYGELYDLSKDGTEILIDGDGEIYLYQVKENRFGGDFEEEGRSPLEDGYDPKWSPDGEKVIFSSRKDEIWVKDIDTREKRKIGEGSSYDW